MGLGSVGERTRQAFVGDNESVTEIGLAGGLCRLTSARLPTAWGEFTITVYRDQSGREHLALRIGAADGPPPLVRLHSECLTGDVFGSVRCDCGEQLQAAIERIGREGRGMIVYLRQEGRGIGLGNKIRAYALQDGGMDTVEANLHLGFPADARSYIDAAAILKDQGFSEVRLLTNNPRKVTGLEECDIRVVQRIGNEIRPCAENYAYLLTKASKLGHVLQPRLSKTSIEEALSRDTQESRCLDGLR
jgi:GTP cyclohydrolase II